MRCCGPFPSGRKEAGTEARLCEGPKCQGWRWRPLTTDSAWQSAVLRAADEIGDKSPHKSKAAKHVQENREAYGLPVSPTHGYCGLAGKPEA